VRRTARHAAHILTVSEFSRQDIAHTYRLSPYKITVTPNGVEPRFVPEASAGEAEAVRRRFGIAGDYLLAVGSIQPRKNLSRLLGAYRRLRERHADFTHQLVIVGRQLWLYRAFLAEVERHEWARDVIVTGYIPDDALPALYRSATALVYPSLFEGFGLPPLEAMACGTPVVTSRTASLPEIVGEAALLVNPRNEVEIAEAVLKIVKDEALRDKLQRAGLARAARFTWQAAAQATLQVYRKVAASSFDQFISEVSGHEPL
jgi:glycosyltransferase involved in cell wall biosynthesis